MRMHDNIDSYHAQNNVLTFENVLFLERDDWDALKVACEEVKNLKSHCATQFTSAHCKHTANTLQHIAT